MNRIGVESSLQRASVRPSLDANEFCNMLQGSDLVNVERNRLENEVRDNNSELEEDQVAVMALRLFEQLWDKAVKEVHTEEPSRFEEKWKLIESFLESGNREIGKINNENKASVAVQFEATLQRSHVISGGELYCKSFKDLQVLADENFAHKLLDVMPPIWPFDRGRTLRDNLREDGEIRVNFDDGDKNASGSSDGNSIIFGTLDGLQGVMSMTKVQVQFSPFKIVTRTAVIMAIALGLSLDEPIKNRGPRDRGKEKRLNYDILSSLCEGYTGSDLLELCKAVAYFPIRVSASEHNIQFNEDEARRYFQQLINAIDYCHSRGVYHRNLKPENLLDAYGNLKLSDFGSSALSQQVRDDGLNYVAPEVLNDRGYDGTKVDVRSCGVILFV